MPLRGEGGVGPLMANAIKNFHFDFLTTSLRSEVYILRKPFGDITFAMLLNPLQHALNLEQIGFTELEQKSSDEHH